jgi:hypothetical protein
MLRKHPQITSKEATDLFKERFNVTATFACFQHARYVSRNATNAEIWESYNDSARVKAMHVYYLLIINPVLIDEDVRSSVRMHFEQAINSFHFWFWTHRAMEDLNSLSIDELNEVRKNAAEYLGCRVEPPIAVGFFQGA